MLLFAEREEVLVFVRSVDIMKAKKKKGLLNSNCVNYLHKFIFNPVLPSNEIVNVT